jgi:hypothetical protein
MPILWYDEDEGRIVYVVEERKPSRLALTLGWLGAFVAGGLIWWGLIELIYILLR